MRHALIEELSRLGVDIDVVVAWRPAPTAADTLDTGASAARAGVDT